jgi:hypothetical protein
MQGLEGEWKLTMTIAFSTPGFIPGGIITNLQRKGARAVRKLVVHGFRVS